MSSMGLEPALDYGMVVAGHSPAGAQKQWDYHPVGCSGGVSARNRWMASLLRRTRRVILQIEKEVGKTIGIQQHPFAAAAIFPLPSTSSGGVPPAPSSRARPA